ncbi:HPP family protein [Gemmobacter denitrificans]|uniref:HPP family protein n=1 Tax=Gemmobacter denitrificans TaxID=3123040 RepID=A0ABU8BXA8_9RHOB
MALWRGLGPAIPPGNRSDTIRAVIGALIGLGLTELVLSPMADPMLGLFLIAPFGATAVLVIAVPNSPLAQPWSVVVGNGLAALAGVTVALLVPSPMAAVPISVALAIAAMILARAVHPPAGAIAMTAAMNPDLVAALGYGFALSPVLLGSAMIVGFGMIWARLTGRRYPFRQFAEPNAARTADPAPMARIGLTETELTDLLQTYRQSLNLGVEDLVRLIGAAAAQAASNRLGPLTAADVMSRDLITVTPETPLPRVTDLFRRHGFAALPVVQQDQRFVGLIFQIDMIRTAGKGSAPRQGKLAAAMRHLARKRRAEPILAQDILTRTAPQASPDMPIGTLLPLLAQGHDSAVPVLEGERIIGIVTQTDLITALVRSGLCPD